MWPSLYRAGIPCLQHKDLSYKVNRDFLLFIQIEQ